MSGFCFGPGASLCALVLILWSHALQTSHAQTTASPEAYSYVCNVPSYLSTAELQQLGTANCIKVNSTVADFAGAVVLDQKHPVVWRDRGQLALEMCQEAEKLMAVGNETEAQQGAYLAVNAWGSLLTQGRKCCTLLRPPYCIDTAFSASTVAIVVPLAILILLFVFSIISSWILPQPKSAPPERLAERESSQLVVRSDTQTPRTPMGSRLKKELLAAWMQSHCLRVLPSATIFAESTASLFSALRDTFDFQEDSARNQFHHLLSLWRSQVAMVADRSLEEGVQVTESTLLSEALGDLYVELLDGFSRWRSKFSDFEAAGISERKAGADCEPGGAQWQAIGSDGSAPAAATESDDPATLSAQLAEMATYLLVWGEAGNVRFMPEVIYFITELALAAEPTDAGALYGFDFESARGAPFRSGRFLSKVIRPIYNVIFDEWYENVDVDKSNGKDKKKLHPGLEKFLPPDTANYDDWNELFCDPARLVAGLLLQDGTRLFDLPHGQRFAALPRMDWQVSLEAAETKTHRELHSLWGVFASTHRIWLLHAVLFFAGICTVTGDAPVLAGGGRPLMGETQLVRFAAVGLLVPIHALLWSCARWQVTGRVLRMSKGPVKCAGSTLLKALWWSLPLVSYAAVRDAEAGSGSQLKLPLVFCVVVHYALSAIGVFILLFLPSDASWNLWSRPFNLWALTRVPLQSRVIRYLFWCAVFALKFWLGLIIFKAMFSAQEALQISLPGRESAEELSQVYFSTTWVADVLVWFVMWFTTWVLFIADTQLWFTLLSAVLGVGTVFVQRGRGMLSWASEDAVAKIPERFSKKVLPYSPAMADIKTEMHAAPFSPTFPGIWDRILEYMRYEDKIDNHHMGDLSFETGDAGHNVYWRQLQQPLGKGKKEKRRGTTESEGLTATSISVASSERGTAAATATRRRIKVPDIFREKTAFEVGFKNYGCLSDPHWPRNADVQWRLLALSRGLGLPMPRPFRAPYFPGITVLIPHYGESILMLKKELFQEGGSNTVPLMDWVKTKYEEEFLTFSNRMQVKHGGSGWPVAGSQWEEYTEQQWGKITAWASMRMQTLWRTVAGMCLYHPALQCHYEAQADRTSKLAQPGIWDPSDCFTCLVSMQMYKFFDKTQLDHTNRMFEKFPSCLKVAFIDCEDKGITAELDAVHHNQKRRYFSSLIDRSSAVEPSGHKKAILRIELPGYPILGDGKGDNQNHAIPFMRGPFAQCIDANQGAYFEQMMLLPCALGEFRSRKRGDGLSKRIVGFPEHITSDIGSIGDFAASAEVAFGTILQRTYSVLGARMHYGHPDIMNKLYMMQQGGVSKATKTVNLSEDIFAGMDFTLRGEDRKIQHSEYFHLAKGRDLGFNTVLGFFSKLASGTGEQVLTRQTFRLGQVLHLPDALAFYYAHAGYYFTQFFVSLSMPLLVFVWLLVLLTDSGTGLDAYLQFDPFKVQAAEVMAQTIGVWFSWLMVLFLVATSLPLFMELWMERHFKMALQRLLQQMCTMSPLLFIFQAKVIGHYVVNEIRFGGATYVATGRGLPTERRPFIGEAAAGELKLKKVGGLYLDYAAIAYYDGATLLTGTVLICVAGGVSGAGQAAGQLWWIFISLGLCIVSWLYAPFIFNPYQFELLHFREDLRCVTAFFLEDSGRHWVEWYDRTQLKVGNALHRSMINISFFVSVFFLAAWYATVNTKIEALSTAYSGAVSAKPLHFQLLVPPVACSLVYCVLAVIFESLMGWSSIVRRRLRRPRRSKAKTFRFGSMATMGRFGSMATAGQLPAASSDEEAQAAPAPNVAEGAAAEAHAGAHETPSWWPFGSAVDVAPPQISEVDSEEDEDDAVEQDAPHAVAEDHTVLPVPAFAGLKSMKPPNAGLAGEAEETRHCFELGIPLAFSAFLVVAVDLSEAAYCLYIFYKLGWRTAYLSGFILKWATLMMCLFLGEGMLRSRCCGVLGCCGMPLQLWVRAHRMARDIACSSLIFWVMAPFVLLNSLNEYLCPGCSAHMLLVYRDPGHLARKEAVVVDILGGDLEDGTWGSEAPRVSIDSTTLSAGRKTPEVPSAVASMASIAQVPRPACMSD